MANEATLMIETMLPIPMTTADTNAIEKGEVLKLSDPYTVSGSDANADIIGGIAAEEKIANDGKTKMAVYRHGVFKMTCSGSVTVGDALASAGTANKVFSAEATRPASQIIGRALETATNAETLLVEVNVGCGGNQVS